jgi:diguanylate cyclase (GGDEF)-like protein
VLLPAGLRAHDPPSAARASVIVVGTCAVVLSAAAAFDPVNATPVGQAACWTIVALLLAGVVACRRVSASRLDGSGVLLLIPLLGAVAVHVTNLLTRDTSAAAQVFLIMPVLLATAQLRAAGAALVTAVAALGNVGVNLALADPARGITDSLFAGAALVTITVVLVGAQGRAAALQQRLQEQANVDPLTGLATRRALDGALDAAAVSDAGTALILIDVDNFKSVNDLHGHPAGDATLRQLGALISGLVRRSEVVIGRMGGDELAVLCTDCALPVAVDRAAALVEAVRATPVELPDGTLLAVSVSIGVAHVGSGDDVHALYGAADQALYRAKRAGRNQLAVA